MHEATVASGQPHRPARLCRQLHTALHATRTDETVRVVPTYETPGRLEGGRCAHRCYRDELELPALFQGLQVAVARTRPLLSSTIPVAPSCKSDARRECLDLGVVGLASWFLAPCQRACTG